MPAARFRLLLSLGPLLSSLSGLAQTESLGQVASRSGSPVPYASVGVKGKAVGTVADEQGQFRLSTLDRALPTDTVVVSCVGYQPQTLPLSQLRQRPRLALAPAATALREVVVRSKQGKQTILGHNGWSRFTALNFYTTRDTVPHDRLGREVGVLMPVKHRSQLESFHLYVASNQFSSVTLRLNLYAVQNGIPQGSLLQQDVIFEVKNLKRGWHEVDLRPYAIELAGQQQVAASVQWLSSQTVDGNHRYFGISTDLSPFHTTILRDKSQENWERIKTNTSLYFTAWASPE
ncbi:carboxypeptidase-like regulatory domain-containing protein [Hymenobacter cellulosivorans]|uniref:Carboxypeptidase-like regulatory domain-containing protein n=1 Tax=Hymenobacter cellulosivorans TaxID=2932249 RepID=A0ABY4F4Z0_9BACT|nr:carboxypeptidase-like regulatory domain-containing protein [Hymenobacter cellulosivorans]UOQ51529.1 carboxypeptidase-like regulatory domain-containing protein [Hymenobacter cellulosivorans]